MAKNWKLITDGLVKNNPTFVLLLGMCPTLATTTSAINGLSMGLATLFVLVLSNVVISLIAPVVPDKVHIPVYIVVIATFVTLLQLLMQAYTPAVYETLGLFIPLIVVNCIVLGRAEAFASKNDVGAAGRHRRGHRLHPGAHRPRPRPRGPGLRLRLRVQLHRRP